jgi:hypothetical protein
MNSLDAILKGIDWTKNVQDSFESGSSLEEIDAATYRIALWSSQLEQADAENPALCFVREMQNSVQQSGALIGLCLYKPSASSSRTLVESCLYYTYFRSHFDELSTLLRNDRYFVSKSEIIEFHKLHTPSFVDRQQPLGLVGRLETWYSKTSAIVHGQVPGAWSIHSALEETSFSETTHALALGTMLEGVQIVNDILLCTVAQQLWNSFSPQAKGLLTKGMSAELRQTLRLDRK